MICQLSVVGFTEFGIIISLWNVCVLLEGSDIVYIKLDSFLVTVLQPSLTGRLALRLRGFKLGLVDPEAEFLCHE